jgi:ABC-type transport system involved in multi-copper enzyme maturation permease subunit
MSAIQHQYPESLEGLAIQKTKAGTKRSIMQIRRTVKFELLKNYRKFISMLLMNFGIFILYLIIAEVTEYNGTPKPDEAVDYFIYYMMMIDFLIMVTASTFGGNMIAEDFEKRTGNLLFPKITKDRLLLGRVIARYLYIALSIGFYYLIVGIATIIKYGGVPKIVWGSMGWALLYGFLLFSFFTFLSSFMKRSSTAIVSGILSVIIIFQLLNMILMYTGATVEPFFILTYFGTIIIQWFTMPAVDARFREIGFGPPGMADPSGRTFMSWITPSASGAAIGMIVYSVVLLGISYYFFRRRQNKAN